MYQFNALNHNENGDPHPQYNYFKKYPSATIAGIDKPYLRIMMLKFGVDATGWGLDDASELRRFIMSADIYEGISEGDGWRGRLTIRAFATPSENDSLPFNGHFQLDLNIDWFNRSFGNNNGKGQPIDIRAYVIQTGQVDSTGIPQYQMWLYASTNPYGNIVIEPKSVFFEGPIVNGVEINNPIYPPANSLKNDWQKIDWILRNNIWETPKSLATVEAENSVNQQGNPATFTLFTAHSNTDDTGWLDLPLATGVTFDDADSFAKYRLKNGVVHIKLKGLNPSATTNGNQLFNVPASIRPVGYDRSDVLVDTISMKPIAVCIQGTSGSVAYIGETPDDTTYSHYVSGQISYLVD